MAMFVLGALMSKKILRKFLLGKNEKEQQFLSFIKASFQGYWQEG